MAADVEAPADEGQGRQPAEEAAAAADVGPQQHHCHRPSVGTWILPKPIAGVASAAVVKGAAKGGGPAAPEKSAEPPIGDSSGRSVKKTNTVTDNVREVFRAQTSLSLSDGDAVDFGALAVAANPFRSAERSYDTLERLGTGGFGSVFRVRHKTTGQMRAMKVIQKSEDAKGMELMLAELTALIRLEHPSLAQFYEYFEKESSICIISELCTLGDFSHVTWSQEPQNTVRLLFQDVLLGVAYCHDQQIAHRDLKFENCLLTAGSDRKVGKIVDFGLARIKRANEAQLVITDRCGTPFFVPPEVVDDSTASYGVKCDNWSFGVMLYIALTRQHPFARNIRSLSMDALFERIRTAPLRTAPMEDLDGAAVELLRALLEKNPNKRISAAAALRCEWFQGPEAGRGYDVCGGDWSLFGSLLSCVQRSPEEDPSSKMRRVSSGTGDGESGACPGILSNLDSFSHLSKFEKTVMMVAAHQSDSAKHEEARAQFLAMDTDNDGHITVEELNAGLAAMGTPVPEAELQAFFATMDSNSDGTIDYHEWLMVMYPPRDLKSKAAVEDLFSFFDADDDGLISREELLAVVGHAEADRLLPAGSDSLNFQEFERLIEGAARHRSANTRASSNADARASCGQQQLAAGGPPPAGFAGQPKEDG